MPFSLQCLIMLCKSKAKILLNVCSAREGSPDIGSAHQERDASMRLAEISEPVSSLGALDSPPPQRTPTPQQEHSSEESDSEASGRSRSRSLTVPRSISRMTRSATCMTRSATRSLRAASVSVQETSVRVASAATRSINKGRTAVQTGVSSDTPLQ